METIFTKAAEQVPNLAVLSFIVGMFLKHLRDQTLEAVARSSMQAEVLDNLHKENLEARRHSEHVLEANTKAAATNTGALNHMSECIRLLREQQQAKA